jgi:hypothetical protein
MWFSLQVKSSAEVACAFWLDEENKGPIGFVRSKKPQ